MTIKFAIRNILKRPFLNLIKVIGLGLALSGVLTIVLFLNNELTFDRFHKKSDRIYRFSFTSPDFFEGKHFARVYQPEYIPKMAESFPEIENYVRLSPVNGGVVKHDQEFIEIKQAFICDSTFFEVFDAELYVGNSDNILNDPGSMVVSESFAKKRFGNVNPIGEILTLPGGQYYAKNIDFTVKGVMKDFPQNSHFHPEFIAIPPDKTVSDRWAWTYILLSENASTENILSGFNSFYSSYINMKPGEVNAEAHLQKISEIHLHSNKLREIEPNRDMTVIYSISIAALMLLLIALANYSNLNTGMAGFSDKFLFVSKVAGSSVWITLKYFLTEGAIIIMASYVTGALITLPAQIVIKKYYGLDLFAENGSLILLVVVSFSLLVLLSCILPLSGQIIRNLRPSMDFKNKDSFRRKGLNKGIIVLQYTISIALIVAVIVIGRQTSFAMKSGLGVENNNLICFTNVHSNVQARFQVFKEELLKYNSIVSVSAMFEPPGGEANDMFQFTMEGYVPDETKNADNMIGVFPCDYSLPGILGLKFIGGNSFSEKYEDNEGSGEYIINETAMRRLNYTNPDEITGKRFGLIFNNEKIKIPAGKIIGVVEDFHLSSIKKQIEPWVLFKRKDLWLINFIVSFQSGNQTKALADIKNVWTKMFPEYPYQYKYISTMYEDVYRTERLLTKLLSLFTSIALFICSMGLLGFSLLITRRRSKEIGMRKINGASTGEIMFLLNRDLLKWILFSFIGSIPIAYFSMNKWLESFAYKTNLSWWIFITAGLSALIIAVLTVSLQSYRAASINPVETLKEE
jgi:putative ABC transport system permease protein